MQYWSTEIKVFSHETVETNAFSQGNIGYIRFFLRVKVDTKFFSLGKSEYMGFLFSVNSAYIVLFSQGNRKVFFSQGQGIHTFFSWKEWTQSFFFSQGNCTVIRKVFLRKLWMQKVFFSGKQWISKDFSQGNNGQRRVFSQEISEYTRFFPRGNSRCVNICYYIFFTGAAENDHFSLQRRK